LLHELPASDHALSVNTSVSGFFCSLVPPTPTAYAEVAGYSGPLPPLSYALSPDAANVAMPGWL
jgi:hypothetical protein